MRVTDLYKKKKNVISMEFFPPRNEAATEKFSATVDTLADLSPDYLSVTFGAGGSTRDGSYQTVKNLVQSKKLPTVAYIAGYCLGPDEICRVLDAYEALGVETIFVIRGDKPADDTFTPHPDSFSYAGEMIHFIKSRYGFTLGCAGYPEGHLEAESLDSDIRHLKEKIDAGAEYVVCQYFYDNRFFFDFVDKCRDQGIQVPILPGIMPVYTVKLTRMLSRVCGSTIPAWLDEKLSALDPEDKAGAAQLGVEVATDQCRKLLEKGVDGLHFYTMNRAKSTTEIIKQLKRENAM
jgi:methylenetetrahydrofolate reductase (NADPH)